MVHLQMEITCLPSEAGVEGPVPKQVDCESEVKSDRTANSAIPGVYYRTWPGACSP